MRPEELRDLGHWNLALAYYSRRDVESLMDENGEKVIAGFVAPLFAVLRERDLANDYSWMRYSAGGFHLRCQIRATTQEAGCAQLEEVQQRFQRFREESPEVFSGTQTLSSTAQRLNRMNGTNVLYEPGTLKAGPAHETGEETVYDCARSFQYVTGLQTSLSEVCLEAVSALGEYTERLEFAHCCAFRVLQLHSSSHAQAAAFATFIQATWLRFFAISGTDTDPRAERTWSRRTRLESAIRSMSEGPAAPTWAGDAELTETLRRRYEEAVGAMQEGREVLDGERPALRAMQVLSLVHQVFNRLGIGIADESAFCHLVGRHHGTGGASTHRAAEHDVDHWIEYWNRNHVSG